MLAIFEILPVVLFLIAFKMYDIYVATTVGIATTLLQVLVYRVWKGKWDRKQVITLIVFLVFGGMTLYFHDPIFVKWKPTVVFWIFGLVIFGSQLFTQKTLMQRLMENVFKDKGEVPVSAWKAVNVMWGLFFIVMGAVNIYVAYHYSNEVWVNFKVYGITSALFVLSIVQTFYLMRYVETK